MRFVVVSAPRSGTGYAAQVFSAMGFPTGHEAVYHLSAIVDKAVIWPPEQMGESSWLLAPFLADLPPDVFVFHQYRDSEQAALSLLHRHFYLGKDGWRMWGESWVGRTSGSHLSRARVFIRRWHELIDGNLRHRPFLSYHVEQVDEAFLLLMARILGREPTPEQMQAALAVPHNANRGRH